LAFFEKRESGFGFFAALWAGFFLDIFSNVFIGFHISIAVFLVALIKLFVKKYVYLPQIP
jgi:ABC-type dipeptide/oligopeptide/nickel transport system permease component